MRSKSDREIPKQLTAFQAFLRQEIVNLPNLNLTYPSEFVEWLDDVERRFKEQ